MSDLYRNQFFNANVSLTGPDVTGSATSSGQGGVPSGPGGNPPVSVLDGLTFTGTPAAGELAVWSGTNTLTNGNLAGDVTTTNTTTTTIAAHAVTYGKMQSLTTGPVLLGGATAGTVAEIAVGNGLLLSGTTLSAIVSNRTMYQYRVKTGSTSGYPGDGYILYNNATQTSATALILSHLTFDGLDIDIFLAFLATGQDIVIQDANASANFQNWTISGSPTNTNPGTSTSYWTVPVTLTSSGGTGTTGFANNARIIVVVFSTNAGTVTTTGSPASGNLAKFTGASSISNGDLSGDLTTSGTLVTTLATVNSNVGTFGDSTHVAQVTVNGKGLVTAASSVAIAGVGGATWLPLVNGAEPPSFITDGAGRLITVAYAP